jgi:hypothetical protein
MAMIPEGFERPTDFEAGYYAPFEGELVKCEVSEDAARFLTLNAANVFAAYERLKLLATEDSGPQK